MPDSPDAFIEPATRFGTPSNTQVFVLLAMAAGAAGGKAPLVVLESTHQKATEVVPLELLKEHSSEPVSAAETEL